LQLAFGLQSIFHNYTSVVSIGQYELRLYDDDLVLVNTTQPVTLLWTASQILSQAKDVCLDVEY
jgi:hypothetical protein